MNARVLMGVLAAIATHVALTFRLPWEHDAGRWLHPNADLPLFLAAAALLGLARGPGRGAVHGLALALFGVVLWHGAGSVVIAFLGKPFEPWHDLLLVPEALGVLLHDLDTWMQVACFLGAAVVAGLGYWLLVVCQRAVLRAASRPAFAVVLLVVAQALVVTAWAGFTPGTSRLREAANHLSEALRGEWRSAAIVTERLAAKEKVLAKTPHDLAYLRKSDVFVLFVESYGRDVFRSPRAASLTTSLRERGARLERAGVHTLSTCLRPSILGGASTLAHAELLSGIRVENRHVYDELVERDRSPLARIFAAAGHRTVNLQPAALGDWPESRSLGFAGHVLRDHLPYSGHAYPWGDVPDQFALQYAVQEIVPASPQPLFLLFASVSSHAPFSEVPPYFEDWSRALQPAAYEGPPAQRFPITWPNYIDHPRLAEAYLATLDYALEVAFGFVERLPRNALVIVLGDHQPPLSGALGVAATTRDVPLHVLSRDEALLKRIDDPAFVRGLVPDGVRPALPSSEFLPRFLAWFSWQ